MKVTFNAKALHSALDFLQVSERPGGDSTYIEQVYVKVSGTKAQLFRYGIGLTKVSQRLDCQSSVHGDHSWQVNYDALKAIIQKIAMRFEDVDFEIDADDDKGHVMLSAGRLKTQLNIMNVEPPDETELNQHTEICVLRSELERIIRRARVASAKNDVRPSLNGVLLETDDTGTLRAIGCDGHRMAMAKCQYLAHEYVHHEIILSNAGVKYLDGIFKLANEDNLVLHFDSAQLSISLENGARLKMQVIDAKYPDWRRTIPLDHKTRVTVDRKELIDSVRTATPLTTQKFRTAKFGMASSGISVSSNSHVGDFSDVVDIAAFEGDEQEVGMNVDYLLDALNAISTESISIDVCDKDRGIVIKEGIAANGIQLVMPLRV